MTRLKIFILVLLLCQVAIAQTPDTVAIMQLIRDAGDVRDKEPGLALQKLNEALVKSVTDGFPHGEALAFARLGRWYFGNNTDSSVAYAHKALALYEELVPDPRNKADMHLLLAEAFDEQGRTDSSAYYYYLLGDEIESGNIAEADFKVDIYTKLAIFWLNVSVSGNNTGKINETIRGYVEKAKQAARQMKDSALGIANIYFTEGIYYHSTAQYDSARYFYLRFLHERDPIQKINPLRRISTLNNIAETYLYQENPNEAMPYIRQVKEMGKDPAQKNYLSFFMAFTGLMEGKALYQQKKYGEAIQVLESSLEQLKTTGGHLRNEIVDAYKTIAYSFEATGNYRQAFINLDMYTTLHDSLSRKEKLDMIARQEVLTRIAKKDQELVQQQLTIAEVRNKVRNKNVVIAGAATILIFSAMIFTMWRRRNLHKQKLQRQQIENLRQKIKIERLNATIAGEEKERTRIARELHDGVGGLITAAKMSFELVKKDAAKENDKDFTQGINLLGEAADELRQAARNLMPEILLQEGLVKAVQVFCERVAEKSDTRISFQALGERKMTDPNFELTVYRVIQELVHNIVKHSKAANAVVQISFHPDGGMNITVEDDGVGINKTSVTQRSGGMGLKNIGDRIRETGGKLDIKSGAGEGTSVYIEYEPQS